MMAKEIWKAVIDSLSPINREGFRAYVMRTRRHGITICMNGTAYVVKRSIVVNYIRDTEPTKEPGR